MPREESFAARLKPDDDGAEAWTLVASTGAQLLVIQHALRLMPRRKEAEVRALHFGAATSRLARAEVKQAVVDPERLRAIWNGSSLSPHEVYGAAEGWRWRVRGRPQAGALALPPLLRELADVYLGYPVLELPFEGEWQQEDGLWKPLQGQGMLAHRASRQGARPWAWLALPALENGGALAATVMRLPGVPLRPVLGWWRWQGAAQPWSGGVAALRRRFERQAQGWELSLTLASTRLELSIRELASLRLEGVLGGSIHLAHVEAEVAYGSARTKGRGALEWFDGEDDP